MRLSLTEDESALRQAVGLQVFLRARRLLARCELADIRCDPSTREVRGAVAGRPGTAAKALVTIEEKVMALKGRQAELFSSVLDGGEFASAQLTAADIRSLIE
jgi:hypothetical protein